MTNQMQPLTNDWLIMQWKRHITLWRLLYWTVAVATFRHSTIGFATLEHGNVALGALSAMAVDIGMILAAERLQRKINVWLITGLLVAATASFYSQVLYAVTNADAIAVALGAEWMHDVAQYVIDWRVLIFPLLLPLLAVVYSFAANEQMEDEGNESGNGATPMQAVEVIEEPGIALLTSGATKSDQCRALSLRFPDATPSQIAALVQCSVSTASRAISDNGSEVV